jgi:hypothetical protein
LQQADEPASDTKPAIQVAVKVVVSPREEKPAADVHPVHTTALPAPPPRPGHPVTRRRCPHHSTPRKPNAATGGSGAEVRVFLGFAISSVLRPCGSRRLGRAGGRFAMVTAGFAACGRVDGCRACGRAGGRFAAFAAAAAGLRRAGWMAGGRA